MRKRVSSYDEKLILWCKDNRHAKTFRFCFQITL